MSKVKANALWNNLTSDQLKALPELQKVAEAMGDADSTRYRESANEAKRAMFEPRADKAQTLTQNIEHPTPNIEWEKEEKGEADKKP